MTNSTDDLPKEVHDPVQLPPEDPPILPMTKDEGRDLKARMLLEILEYRDREDQHITEYLAEYRRCVPVAAAEELDASRAWEPRWKKRLSDYLGMQPTTKPWPVTTGDVIRGALMDKPSIDRAIDRWNAIVNLDGTTADSIRNDIRSGDTEILSDAQKLIGLDGLYRAVALRILDDVGALNEDEQAELARRWGSPKPITEYELRFIVTPAVNFAVAYWHRASERSRAGLAKGKRPMREFEWEERQPPANNPLQLSLVGPWTRPASHMLVANRLVIGYGESIAKYGFTSGAIPRIAAVKRLVRSIDRDDLTTQRLAARALGRLCWYLAHSDGDGYGPAVPDVRSLSNEADEIPLG